MSTESGNMPFYISKSEFHRYQIKIDKHDNTK